MPQNLEQLGGAGSVGAMLTVFLDKLAELGLSEFEWGVIAAGLASIIGFVVKRLPPAKSEVVLTNVVPPELTE